MIDITDLIIHKLSSGYDICDEYTTKFNFDFMLSKPQKFTIYRTTYIIDRIQMYPDWGGDDIIFNFANANRIFEGFTVPLRFIKLIYKKIKEAEQAGKLGNHEFSDEIEDMIHEQEKEPKED